MRKARFFTDFLAADSFDVKDKEYQHSINASSNGSARCLSCTWPTGKKGCTDYAAFNIQQWPTASFQ
jgi:hypothetical protein